MRTGARLDDHRVERDGGRWLALHGLAAWRSRPKKARKSDVILAVLRMGMTGRGRGRSK